MPENYFDDWVAQHYEVLWPHLFDPEVVEPAVSFLADLAGDGRALELGIGTGRLALPLSRRGIRVDGIELSAAMVEQLRSQPGSADIDVTIGDFSTTKVNGTFTLAYLVRNTIMNLTTQDAQVECFLNVARHLEPGGFFVIEVIVPPWQRLPPGETVIPFDVSPAHLGFDEIDVATQNSWSHHYWFVDGETKTFSAPFRNVWPSELDLMARLAGMALRDRWSDWNREPFTSTEPQPHLGLAEARVARLFLAVRGGLDAVELRVLAAVRDQRLVRAHLDDACAVEHHDEVGHAHGREPVGDEHGDPARVGTLVTARRRGVALEQRVLGLGVERGRGLVEDEEQRMVAHEAARQCELLPLTERDLDAVVPRDAELRVEPACKPFDDIARAGAGDGGVDRGSIVEPLEIPERPRSARQRSSNRKKSWNAPPRRARHSSAGMRARSRPSTVIVPSAGW